MTELFKYFPNIDLDENFILREQTLDDKAAFFRYISDPEVSKFILSSIPRTMEESHDEILYWINLFKRKESIYWAIADKTTNEMIGAIGYNDWNRYNNRAEISYDLSRQYWQRGIMTKAVNKVVEYGFKTMRINRIQASTIKINKASQKLLETTGFKHEGTLRQYRYHNGKFYDIEMYATLNSY